MPSFARFRILVVILVMVAAAIPLLAAADGSVSSLPSGTSSYILIGFAGGFVRHDNPLHGPVHLAQKIQPELPRRVQTLISTTIFELTCESSSSGWSFLLK